MDSFVQLRAPAEYGGERQASVEVIDPDGRGRFRLTKRARRRLCGWSDAGFYQIRLANGRDMLIGVNPDRRESDLQPIAEMCSKLWSGSAGQRFSAGRGRFVARRKAISSSESVVVRYAACIGSGSGGDGIRQPLHGHAAGGNMSKQSELNSYIARVQQRLRLGAWLRGAAIFTGTALVVTLAPGPGAQPVRVSCSTESLGRAWRWWWRWAARRRSGWRCP